MNMHPLPQQRQMSRELRQIGLGIMGLADMFIKLGIKYGSCESISLIHQIGRTMINEALRQSALLAKEDGPFPRYNAEAVLNSPFLLSNADEDVLELVKEHGLRNSQLLTIPPTGSISTLIGCSNGVEPIFQVAYTRKSESLHQEDTYYKVFTSIIKEYMDQNAIYREEDLPEFIVTTSNLDYRDRIEVQATWQQYIDASISSTVNVPNEFTIEEVEDLYIYAWEKGLKGITIYRDGCARSGILISNKAKTSRLDRIDELKREIDQLAVEQLQEDPDTCPMCGGKLNHSGGCAECQDCGYSPCSI
jgi:ribonucleoside-diphosphate reductase alpha chain